MNDRELDRLMADAAPATDLLLARREVRDAERRLVDDVVAAARPRRRPTAVVVAAVAACVAGLVAVPVLVAGGREPEGTVSAAPPSVYTASALRAAQRGPRLVLDQPGWTLLNVDAASMAYHAGPPNVMKERADGTGADLVRRGRDLDVDWRPAGLYAGYVADRDDVSAVQAVPVLGTTGRMVTYGPGDYAVLLPPGHGTFVEIRATGVRDLAAYLALLGSLRQVSAAAWLDRLPGSVLVPRRDGSTLADLRTLPLPAGLTARDLLPRAAVGYDQFAASVLDRVACGWVTDWAGATGGREAERARTLSAVRALLTWPLLARATRTDEVAHLRQVADDIASGSSALVVEQSLGCGS